jgi:hypothetical protein
MKFFAPLAITCELDYSISLADTSVAACSSVWCVRCVQLDADGPYQVCVILKQKPRWSYLAQTISTGVAESLHLIGNFFELNQFGVGTWPLLSARFRPTEANFLRDDMTTTVGHHSKL